MYRVETKTRRGVLSENWQHLTSLLFEKCSPKSQHISRLGEKLSLMFLIKSCCLPWKMSFKFENIFPQNRLQDRLGLLSPHWPNFWEREKQLLNSLERKQIQSTQIIWIDRSKNFSNIFFIYGFWFSSYSTFDNIIFLARSLENLLQALIC